jgi:D-alanine-D-alanine ligase
MPYTGSGAHTLAVTLDKHLAKLLASAEGVRTPGGCFVRSPHDFDAQTLRPPLIVKPNFEGSSKGIREASVFEQTAGLKAFLHDQLRDFPDGLLVEEYVRGHDVTVPFLEAAAPARAGVLAGVEYVFQGEAAGRLAYDYELKNDLSDLVEVRVPALLSEETARDLHRLSGLLFERFRVRDLGRADFRLGADGELYFLELNPLPSLEPGAGIYAAALLEGLGPDDVLAAVVDCAARRWQLSVGASSAPRRVGRRGGSRSLGVGLAFDLAANFTASPTEPDDRLEEYDAPDTIDAIEAALRSRGTTTRRLGGGAELLDALVARPPGIVFNISEGWGTRSREAHVPAVLEMLGLPHTHSDPFTMAVSLDKAAAKSIVSSAGVPVPAHQLVESPDFVLQLELPVVAKPLREGSSMGIRASSIIRNRSELDVHVTRLLDDYRQPVLLEEFCPGAELTVGILGNGLSAEPVGVMEIVPRNGAVADFLYSVEAKRNYLEEVEYLVPPRVPSNVHKRAVEIALAAYHALGCRDVARIDLRIGADGEPKFLEGNPMPGLHPEKSDLVILCREVGIGYDDLILRILDTARARYSD